MKGEQKLRNGAYDAEFQVKASGHENTVPPYEQHPEWQAEMAITDVEHKLLHLFLKETIMYAVGSDEKIKEGVFYVDFVRWVYRRAGLRASAKLKNLLSKEVFWHHIEAKLGEVSENGEIHLATLQDQIAHYFNKLLLDEFFWSIKNTKGPNVLGSNKRINIAKLYNYYFDWCINEKGLPRNNAEWRIMIFVTDERFFREHLESVGLSIPKSGLIPLEKLKQKIADAYPEEPVKYW